MVKKIILILVCASLPYMTFLQKSEKGYFPKDHRDFFQVGLPWATWSYGDGWYSDFGHSSLYPDGRLDPAVDRMDLLPPLLGNVAIATAIYLLFVRWWHRRFVGVIFFGLAVAVLSRALPIYDWNVLSLTTNRLAQRWTDLTVTNQIVFLLSIVAWTAAGWLWLGMASYLRTKRNRVTPPSAAERTTVSREGSVTNQRHERWVAVVGVILVAAASIVPGALYYTRSADWTHVPDNSQEVPKSLKEIVFFPETYCQVPSLVRLPNQSLYLATKRGLARVKDESFVLTGYQRRLRVQLSNAASSAGTNLHWTKFWDGYWLETAEPIEETVLLPSTWSNKQVAMAVGETETYFHVIDTFLLAVVPSSDLWTYEPGPEGLERLIDSGDGQVFGGSFACPENLSNSIKLYYHNGTDWVDLSSSLQAKAEAERWVSVKTIALDREDRPWLSVTQRSEDRGQTGVYRLGLWRLDNGEWRAFPMPFNWRGVELSFDTKDRLWVATTEGVMRYDGSLGKDEKGRPISLGQSVADLLRYWETFVLVFLPAIGICTGCRKYFVWALSVKPPEK